MMAAAWTFGKFIPILLELSKSGASIGQPSPYTGASNKLGLELMESASGSSFPKVYFLQECHYRLQGKRWTKMATAWTFGKFKLLFL
jgi:hypothetical protein